MSGGAGSILGGVLGGLGGGSGSSASSSAQTKELSRHLMSLLTEDDVQLITTLELNRLATYSYHVDSLVAADNDLLETMVLTLQSVLSKPAAYSTTALLKGLAVTEWLLTYGADRVLMEAKVLGRHVEVLQTYNTVLLAQQSSGAAALLMRIKGGGVDQGGPVRAKADRVMRLLCDHIFYQQERASKSDPGSLVPVGSHKKVGFVTDEVRLHLLRKRVAEETERSRIKSNLQKPEGGFGSGYNSRDGKSVVGAAHGIEEMLKMAQKEKDRFVDGAPAPGVPVVNAQGDLLPGFAVGAGGGGHDNGVTSSSFSEYRAPTLVDYAAPPSSYSQPTQSAEVDLLDFSADAGGGAPTLGSTPTASFEEDLLGISSSIPPEYHPSPLLMDLAAAPSASSDCLMATASTTSSMSTVVTSNDLLGGSLSAATMTTQVAAPDPFAGVSQLSAAPSTSAAAAASTTLSGLLGSLSLASRSSTAATYSTPSVDVTPKLPEPNTATAISMSGTPVAYPSAATLMSAPTTGNHSSFDRFAALDVLANSNPSTAPTGANPPTGVGTGLVGWEPQPYATVGTAAIAPTMPSSTPSFSSSPAYAWNNNGSDRGIQSQDGGDGFVMGGTAGAGLHPLGPAPSAPPPPPPPSSAGASTFPFY